jgi:hypothetical protein
MRIDRIAHSDTVSSIVKLAGNSYVNVATCAIAKLAMPAATSGIASVVRCLFGVVAVAIGFQCQKWNGLQEQEKRQHCQ